MSSVARADDTSNDSTPFQVFDYQPFQSWKRDAEHLFDRQGTIFFISGVGASFLSTLADGSMEKYFGERHRIGNLQNLGNDYLGTGIPGVVLGLGLLAYGEIRSEDHEIQTGQALLEAITFNFIATETLKFGARRERPDGSDNQSFPSGHTSTVFAAAGVIQEAYGWEAGIACDFLGVLTGISRISADRHWFSDTVAGGVLGYWIGSSVGRGHFASIANREKPVMWSITPSVGPDMTGLNAQLSF